jgi:Rod binding domain-containing protein
MSGGLKINTGMGPAGAPGDAGLSVMGAGSRNTTVNPEKVARDFESFFIFTMIKEMEKATLSSKKGFMQETYMSVVYEKLGEYLAGKGMGLKEAITKYLERDNIKVSASKVDNRLGGDLIHQSSRLQPMTGPTRDGTKEEHHED